MGKKITMVYIFLVISTLLLVGCSQAGGLGSVGSVIVPYKDDSFTIKPLSKASGTVDMRNGAIFEGYLTIRGGNNDIEFYVQDSYGKKVLSAGRVTGRYDFNYKATSEGFHTFYFDNNFSVFTTKEVFIHYRIR